MTRITWLTIPLVLMLACQAKEGPALPAATGAGAPPAPAVPTLSEVAAKAAQPATAIGGPAGTGSLRPQHEAALGPKETGAITTIAVEEGDRVKKGQVLFRIDAAQADLAVDQAKAALASAEVQKSAAQLEFDRTKALRERGSVSPDVYDQVKSRLDAAVSAVAQGNAALAMAQRHATNMVVAAPFDGVITEKRMNVGEIATMMPPSVVLVLQDIDALELRARLPESALRSVHEGSEIDVRFPSIDVSRRVKVKRISPTVDPRNRTIEIVADVDNKDHHLLGGMLAEVEYAQEDHDTTSAPAAPVKAKAKANESAQPRMASEERNAGR
jgi:RND family efflux transporter MFP subunit